MSWYQKQITGCTYRRFTTGFFYGKPDEHAQVYDQNTYGREYTYLGIIGETDGSGRCRIEQRNKFSVGETIEIMKPDGRDTEVKVESIQDAEEGGYQESAPHSRQNLWVKLSQAPEPMDLLRRKEL